MRGGDQNADCRSEDIHPQCKVFSVLRRAYVVFISPVPANPGGWLGFSCRMPADEGHQQGTNPHEPTRTHTTNATHANANKHTQGRTHINDTG